MRWTRIAKEYTVWYATTNDAKTNECYNERFLSIKSGCYNEHRRYNERGFRTNYVRSSIPQCNSYLKNKVNNSENDNYNLYSDTPCTLIFARVHTVVFKVHY